ncbi:hypothetical protein V2S66_33820 [Streptomyces sp. V4-01]|uniref:Uncharacterized protein n=1 Tax=Actinacidiphila polyblastidii TaxID=3110430 RepID=A0ABU7PM71_9ACTN|nr:hypothetical protein [Streptomyces sp. V4-01]
MYVLVPDDPVFFAKFQSLEGPLLSRLYRLHSEGLESDDERVIADAYDSWVQVLLKLPLWSQWHTPAVTGERAGYDLYGPRGDQLTSVYPIEVAAVDLGHLTACLDLFAAAQAKPPQAGPPESGDALTDAFRRVMDVLLLPAPERLLGALRHVASGEPVASVTLPAEQEAEYRRFCEEIVTILSSGDAFAYRSHRALYP